MAKNPNAIKNPLPNGKATYSKDNYWWTDGYNYRNELKTIHPEYNWVRYVAYVVEADKKKTHKIKESTIAFIQHS